MIKALAFSVLPVIIDGLSKIDCKGTAVGKTLQYAKMMFSGVVPMPCILIFSYADTLIL